jgi:hypothetical protein
MSEADKVKAQYIKKSTLEWCDLWNELGFEKDRAGRWFAGESSPDWVSDFLINHRYPSRAYPHSHSKPILTQKFAKLLCEKDPKLAVKLKVGVIDGE